jgi:hypothetical protein
MLRTLSCRAAHVNRAVGKLGITLLHGVMGIPRWGKIQISNCKLQVNSKGQLLNSKLTQLLKPQLYAASNDLSGAKQKHPVGSAATPLREGNFALAGGFADGGIWWRGAAWVV